MSPQKRKNKVQHGVHAKSDINVTPLIDIVLVLLIVFIVMVPGLSKALPVVVPQVIKTDKPTPPDPRNPPLVLSITPTADNKSYEFMLQSDKIELQDIANRLCPVVQLQPAGMRKVFLKVDEETPYQVAVNVLDQVRVASERAKKETAAKPEWGGFDGGDTKVAISLKKNS
ncbi:MAG: biopolymer transporter ExbD [Holophagaceae bacterium]|nr:biopolymer transporter ExbD [Holophagaceae bacterium]